jgi:hypothetical protein
MDQNDLLKRIVFGSKDRVDHILRSFIDATNKWNAVEKLFS